MKIDQHTVIDAFTREETAPGVTSAFPYRALHFDLDTLPERLCPWHWHNEVELFFMTDGAMTYHIPGRSIVFSEGDIGFVNADVLHMTTPISTPRCIQQEHIFLPRLIGGLPGDAIQTAYVDPLIQNHSVEIIRIPADDPAAPGLRQCADRAYRAYAGRDYGYEMSVRSALGEVWLELARRTGELAPMPVSSDSMRIKAMLQYISVHYAEPITLDEIASVAHISAREGNRCFRRRMNTTAFDYLINLRIDRACDLLRSSNLPITEIASRCGFSSASYFGKVFRERLSATPREYRNAHSEP